MKYNLFKNADQKIEPHVVENLLLIKKNSSDPV